MPYTFSPEADGSMLLVKGSRQAWVPRPVKVEEWDVSLFAESPLCNAKPVLANAFVVKDVPYRWDRGRIVLPQAPA
jgi:hypothetical protein